MGDQLKYGIVEPFIGSSMFVEITAGEFAEIRRAKQFLQILVSVEEKWDLLLENYVEYERELIDLALHQMVFAHTNLAAYRGDRRRVTRRVVNLLATCRLYADQVKEDFKKHYSCTAQEYVSLEASLSKEQDESLAYRVLAEIRNYAQHRDLPVHVLTHDAAWTGEDSGRELVFQTRVGLDVPKLLDDPISAKRIGADLKSLGQRIDLSSMIREYMEAAGRVHETVRKITSKNLVAAEETIKAAQCRGEKVGEDATKVFGIVALNSFDKKVESEIIAIDAIEYRKFLATKNRDLVNLSARTVSASRVRSGVAAGA